MCSNADARAEITAGARAMCSITGANAANPANRSVVFTDPFDTNEATHSNEDTCDRHQAELH